MFIDRWYHRMSSYGRPSLWVLAALLLAGLISTSNVIHAVPKPGRLLVVTVTKTYRHQSIPLAEQIIKELGEESRSYTVDYARTDEELAVKMSASSLQNYDGVLFASTSGDIPLPDREAFLTWIKAGNSFVGVHAASDTLHNYPPYVEMIGGEFETHGPQLTVTLHVEDAKHPATKHFAKSFDLLDEIYIFKNFSREKVHMLLALDRNPNKNDSLAFNRPGYYPIAWYHNYGKGRVFYTALGHREDVWRSEPFKRHVLGGIRWAFKQLK